MYLTDVPWAAAVKPQSSSNDADSDKILKTDRLVFPEIYKDLPEVCEYFVQLLIKEQNKYVDSYAGSIDVKPGFYVKKVAFIAINPHAYPIVTARRYI